MNGSDFSFLAKLLSLPEYRREIVAAIMLMVNMHLTASQLRQELAWLTDLMNGLIEVQQRRETSSPDNPPTNS